MALVTWQGTIQNDEGQPVASASIEVRSTAAGTPLATLYSDAAGTSLANPFTTNADGFGQFYVQPGEYTIEATSGGSSQTWTVQLSTGDFEVDDAAEFFAGTLTYVAGTIVRSRNEGFAWMAVASGGHITVGSQQFTVLPAADGTVRLEQFGWTSGDIAATLRLALQFPKIVLAGNMELASEVLESVANTTIEAQNGATITVTATAGADRAIELTDVNSLVVRGNLTINCDDRAAVGLMVRGLVNSYVDIQGVEVLSCNQTGSATTGAQGITILCDSGSGYAARVSGCRVDGVTRTIAGGTCSGITVTDYRVKEISNNVIRNVLKGSGTVDADGIRAFDQVATGIYEHGATNVTDNVLENCEGRFIKGQTVGTSLVDNNLMRFDSAVDLIASWRGVDWQIDGATITNNRFISEVAWTGGSDATVFFVRAPAAAPEYTGQQITATIADNTVTVLATAPDLSRIVFMDVSDLATRAYTCSFTARNNFATTASGWGNGSCGVIGVSVRNPVSFASGATANISIIDNRLDTTNFMERLQPSGGTAAHGGLGDLTGDLVMTVTGNSCPVNNSIAILPYNTNDCFTSSIHIADNAIGNLANWWNPTFDFAEIRGGRFYVASAVTPATTNGPANGTFGIVSREGAHLIVDMGGGVVNRRALSLTAIGSATSWTESLFT